jgi:hypothetical protein
MRRIEVNRTLCKVLALADAVTFPYLSRTGLCRRPDRRPIVQVLRHSHREERAIMDETHSPLSLLVDFHNHFVGPGLPLTTLPGLAAAQRSVWEGINTRLADPGALTASIEASGISAGSSARRRNSSRIPSRPTSIRASTMPLPNW